MFAFIPLINPIIGDESTLCNTVVDANGCFADPCTTCNFLAIAGRILYTLIALGVILAVCLVIYAGWLYLTTTIADKTSKAKKIFWNSFFGLIIILASWLIVDTLLSTIASGGSRLNGILLDSLFCSAEASQVPCQAVGFMASQNTFELTPPNQKTFCFVCNDSGGSVCAHGADAAAARAACEARIHECTSPQGGCTDVTTPPHVTGPPSASESELRTQILAICGPVDFSNCSTAINKSPCPPGVRYQDVPGGCTSVAGFKAATLTAYESAALACGQFNIGVAPCIFLITGGTELGHAGGTAPGSHAGGDKFDLQSNGVVNNFVRTSGRFTRTTAPFGTEAWTDTVTGALWVLEASPAHWDVNANPGAGGPAD